MNTQRRIISAISVWSAVREGGNQETHDWQSSELNNWTVPAIIVDASESSSSRRHWSHDLTHTPATILTAVSDVHSTIPPTTSYPTTLPAANLLVLLFAKPIGHAGQIVGHAAFDPDDFRARRRNFPGSSLRLPAECSKQCSAADAGLACAWPRAADVDRRARTENPPIPSSCSTRSALGPSRKLATGARPRALSKRVSGQILAGRPAARR